MFKSWCAQQGFCHGKRLSHVLMDGGILSVPFERLDDFYRAYVDAVTREEPVFVVEQKTPTFHFFVDLDYKDTEELTVERLEDLCTTICDRVAAFSPARALVSVAEPKPCGRLIKHGIHVNWYGFVVDHASAMALHSHIVSALTLLFPTLPWNDIVDTSVYKGSGFRMPWSHKRAKHDACAGAGCAACEKGRVTQGPYRPIFMYDGALTCIHDDEPSLETLRLATVRTEETNHVVVKGSVREEGSFTVQETKDVFRDQETQDRLEAFIRKHMDGQAAASVTKVFVHDKIHLVSTTSKYCENIGRDHASNHVWFLVEGDGTISQKCFCRCETTKGRRSGFCKDFTGRKHVLSDTIVKVMYPSGSSPPRKRPTAPARPEGNPVDVLEAFVNRHMVAEGTSVSITSLTKKSGNEYRLDTTYACQECHTEQVPFVIKKKPGRIQQKCTCKTREHVLTDKSIKVL